MEVKEKTIDLKFKGEGIEAINKTILNTIKNKQSGEEDQINICNINQVSLSSPACLTIHLVESTLDSNSILVGKITNLQGIEIVKQFKQNEQIEEWGLVRELRIRRMIRWIALLNLIGIILIFIDEDVWK